MHILVDRSKIEQKKSCLKHKQQQLNFNNLSDFFRINRKKTNLLLVLPNYLLSVVPQAGSLHVRVRRDADEQLVLAHVVARLSPLVPVLRVQVVKDDWQHSSSLFAPSPATFAPSPFTPAQPNNNLLFSGASSLDPDKFPYKPR